MAATIPQAEGGTSLGGRLASFVKAPPADQIDWPLMLSAFFATFLLFLPFAPLDIDIHHDGIMLKPALDVYAGHQLFRDSFSQYGALTTYIHAAFLSLLGPHLLSLRIATVFAYSLGIAFFVGSWRFFLPRSLAICALVIWWIFAPFYTWTMLPWSSVTALPFQALALLLLLKGIKTEKLTFFGLSGISAALVFWCRQPVGGALGLAVAAFLILAWNCWGWRGTVKALLSFCGGCAVVHGSFFGWLFLTDSLSAWFYQNVQWPYQWHGAATGLFLFPVYSIRALALIILGFFVPVLLHQWKPRWIDDRLAVGGGMLWGVAFAFLALRLDWIARLVSALTGGWPCLFWLVVPLMFGRIAWAMCRENGRIDRQWLVLLAMVMVGEASILQFHPCFERRHIFWAIAPMVGLLVYAIWQLAPRRPVFTAVALYLLFLPAGVEQFGSAFSNLGQDRVVLTRPEAVRGMRVEPSVGAEYDRLADALDDFRARYPDRPVLIEGSEALWGAFTANRANPGPLYIRWPGLGDSSNETQKRANFITTWRPIVIFQDAPDTDLAQFMKTWRYVDVMSSSRLVPPWCVSRVHVLVPER